MRRGARGLALVPDSLTHRSEIGNSATMRANLKTETPGGSEIPPVGDRRSQTRAASDRRRAAEDALLDALLLPHTPKNGAASLALGHGEAPTHGATRIGIEGQTLLVKALQRLERQEDVDAAVAWSLGEDGEARVLAAMPAESANRIEPSLDLAHGLSRLDRATRLTEIDRASPLNTLAPRGVSAAAPVAGLGAKPAAALLLFAKRPGRTFRPRTIAILDEVVSKLSQTFTTSLALERLARLDGAVQQLDRLAALGGLVTEIVHEIRNPLVSVKTFLQLLPDRLDDPEFHQDFRAVVGDEVARLERMLDDLLRHARPTTRDPIDAWAHVDEAIETTLQLLTYRCRERGIELETQLRAELPALGLSRDALRQLLLNLLLNATEVTPQGGRIELVADWSERVANHVELRIEDQGPGLDPALRERVFEPFWTTRSEGPGGLGLAICKRIVDSAGGRIEVAEGRDKGACFRIELPIAAS